MPLNKLLSLCERISNEHDSSKMNLLPKKLEVLLREEQGVFATIFRSGPRVRAWLGTRV